MTDSPETKSPFSAATTLHQIFGAGIVFLVTLLVFGRSVGFTFVLWDDDINIHANVHIRDFSFQNLGWMLSDFTYALRYQPLSWLGWAFDYRIWGMNPLGYHLSNLLLHASCGAMAYFALLKIARDVFDLRAPSRCDVFLICIAAIFWSAHPLRAEVVSWVTGRRYSQVMFFLLASYLLDPGVPRLGSPGSVSLSRSIAGFIAFAASLLSYPLALEWPLLLGVLDFASWRENRGVHKFPWKLWITRRAPYFVLSAALTLLNLTGRYFIPGRWSQPSTLAEFSLGARFIQALYALAVYPLEILFPWKLSPYYPRLVDFDPTAPVFMFSAAFILIVTCLLAVLCIRIRWPFACWMAYCIMMFTKLGWTESPHFASDRYVHLASFSASVAVFMGLRKVLTRTKSPTSAMRVKLVAVCIVAAYAFAAFFQSGIWRDSETLFSTMSRRLGSHPFQAEILGRLGDVRRIKNQHEEALEAYTRVLEFVPLDARARYNRPLMLSKLGRLDDAMMELRDSIAQADDPNLRVQLASHLLQQNQIQAAEEHLLIATSLDEKLLAAWMLLGQIYESRSEQSKAAEMYSKAAEVAPDNSTVRDALDRVRAVGEGAP